MSWSAITIGVRSFMTSPMAAEPTGPRKLRGAPATTSMTRPLSYESWSVLPGAAAALADAPPSRTGADASAPSTETVTHPASAGRAVFEPRTTRNRPPTTAASWASSQAGAAPLRASSAEA